MALKLLQLLFWKMRFEVFLAVASNIDDIEQIYSEMAFLLVLSSQNFDVTNGMATQTVDLLTQMMQRIPGQENLIFKIRNCPL